MTIKLTEAAYHSDARVLVGDIMVAQVRRSAEESGMQNVPLRIAAQRRDDGSIEYAMGFDEEAESDTTREYDALTVVVAPTSVDLLSGAVLDFVDVEAGEKQFIFLNPNDPTYVPPSED